MEAAQLDHLRKLLPPASQLDEGQDLDEQTRAVLLLLLDTSSPTTHEPIAPDPNTCPNCGSPTTSSRSPYCSDACRQESAFVRQFRHGVETGSIHDPERQAALGQKLWHLLGGGYPRRTALILERVRKKVFERQGGRCEVCGEPATRIDNIGSG